MENDIKNGFGILLLSNGVIYLGEFKIDKIEGYGDMEKFINLIQYYMKENLKIM